MKTLELIGPALDWAVARCERVQYRYLKSTGGDYNGNSWWETRNYSTDWAQGGPITERLGMTTWQGEDGWYASIQPKACYTNITEVDAMHGPTKLVASMRCYVEFVLGDEVKIPKELAYA